MLGEKVVLKNCKFCNAIVGVAESCAEIKIGHMCKICKKKRYDRYFKKRNKKDY